MNPDHMLEIYKIHVEMADRVSQRREGANRLFVTLISAIIVLSAMMLRFGPGSLPIRPVLTILSLTGLLLVFAWIVVIMSYRQLNSGKFKTLHDLEQQLPFSFYATEWKYLKEGRDWRKYMKLTVVETFVPLTFGVLFLAICIWSYACLP